MSADYAIVTTKFRGVAPSGKAIFVDGPDARGGAEVPIPRSLLHGGDDLNVGDLFDGDEFTFRVMPFKAEELGFA